MDALALTLEREEHAKTKAALAEKDAHAHDACDYRIERQDKTIARLISDIAAAKERIAELESELASTQADLEAATGDAP